MNDSTNQPRPPYEEPPTLTVNLWRMSEHEWYGCTLPTKSTPAVEAWGATRADVTMRLMVAAKGNGR